MPVGVKVYVGVNIEDGVEEGKGVSVAVKVGSTVIDVIEGVKLGVGERNSGVNVGVEVIKPEMVGVIVKE